MPFAVLLTENAARDLESLYNYIHRNDAPGKADHVLEQIENALDSLAEFPERGRYPKELDTLGIRQYREIFFKPYRIIYQVTGETVHVFLIADGRRDMRSLLEQRLLKV